MDFAVPLLFVSENPIIPGDKKDGNITDAGSCPPPPVLRQRELNINTEKKIIPPQILGFSTHLTANAL